MPAVRNGISLIRTKAAIDGDAVAPHCAVPRASQEVHLRRHAPPLPDQGSKVEMTARIREFLKQRNDEGPCLVVDLDVVRDNYRPFAKALPDTKVFYAVKANPAPEILKLLAGSAAASTSPRSARPKPCWRPARRPSASPTATPSRRRARSPPPSSSASRCSPSTARPRSRRSRAPRPARRVICRIHCDGTGAEWPLSRKFGCEPDYAADILELAHRRGLVAHGISFHVGSQQHNVEAWDRALASTAAIFRTCAERGITLAMVNLGGGFPARYVRKTPKLEILRQGDLPRAAPAFRQRASRRPSSSRAAAWSAMPA